MKKHINSIYSFLMIDNIHEEDGEEYVYLAETNIDRIMCKVAIGVIAFMIALSCIL